MLKWKGDFTLPRLRANLARKYEFHPAVEPMYDEYYSLYLGKSTVERRPSKPVLRPDPGRINLNRPSPSTKMTTSSSLPNLPSVDHSMNDREKENPLVEAASRKLWREAHGIMHYFKEAIDAAEEDPPKGKSKDYPGGAPTRMKKPEYPYEFPPKQKHWKDKAVMATQFKSIQVAGVQKALKEGAKLDWRNHDWNGATLFIKSARFGEDTTLMYLEALGAEKFMVDWSQRSALHWASLEGHATTAQWLLERFPPEMVDMRDESGDSALHLSARHGHLPIVRLLVRAKADPEGSNNASETPLSVATARRCHHIVRFLEDCKRTPDNAELMLQKMDRECSYNYYDLPMKPSNVTGNLERVKLSEDSSYATQCQPFEWSQNKDELDVRFQPAPAPKAAKK